MVKSNKRRKVIAKASGPHSEPVNWLPGLETLGLGALIEGGKLTAQGGKALVDWLNREGPLLVQVMDSRHVGSSYTISLQLTNLTIHGIYIESCKLDKPIVKDEILTRVGEDMNMDASSLGRGTRKPPIRGEGKLLPPGDKEKFDIVIRDNDLSYIYEADRQVGSATLTYRVLNEESPRPKKFTFNLRS
jgi:hypothetical protein